MCCCLHIALIVRMPGGGQHQGWAAAAAADGLVPAGSSGLQAGRRGWQAAGGAQGTAAEVGLQGTAAKRSVVCTVVW